MEYIGIHNKLLKSKGMTDYTCHTWAP